MDFCGTHIPCALQRAQGTGLSLLAIPLSRFLYRFSADITSPASASSTQGVVSNSSRSFQNASQL